MFFFCSSTAEEKPEASVIVLWGSFSFRFLKSFVSLYKTVKVNAAVHKLICVKLLLAMTDKTGRDTSEKLRLYEAGFFCCCFVFFFYSLYF